MTKETLAIPHPQTQESRWETTSKYCQRIKEIANGGCRQRNLLIGHAVPVPSSREDLGRAFGRMVNFYENKFSRSLKGKLILWYLADISTVVLSHDVLVWLSSRDGLVCDCKAVIKSFACRIGLVAKSHKTTLRFQARWSSCGSTAMNSSGGQP